MHPGALTAVVADGDAVELDMCASVPDGGRTRFTLPKGDYNPILPAHNELTRGQAGALAAMLQSWSIGRAVCLVGPRGEGKTFVAHRQHFISPLSSSIIS